MGLTHGTTIGDTHATLCHLDLFLFFLVFLLHVPASATDAAQSTAAEHQQHDNYHGNHGTVTRVFGSIALGGRLFLISADKSSGQVKRGLWVTLLGTDHGGRGDEQHEKSRHGEYL